MRQGRPVVRLVLALAVLLAGAGPGHGQPRETPGAGTPSRGSGEPVRGTYYLPDHFYWYTSGPDKAREKKSLIPLLSPTQAVVGFTWTAATRGQEAAKRGRLQDLLRQPPAGLPAIASATECDQGPTFVAFLLTLKGEGGPGRMLSFLNALHAQGIFDFVTPVFFLPDRLAYPSHQFEVEFLPVALITEGEAAIRRFNSANHAGVAAINENVYTLALPREAPANVLVTVLRYMETPWIVKHARVSWRRVLTPLTASAELRTPLRVALVDIRDPVEYVVTVERDRDITLMPETTSQPEIKAWMLKAVELPEELVEIKEITRTTEALGPSRERDRISFVFLFAKAGLYDLPVFEVRYTLKDASGTRKVERLPAGGPFRLTVDEHLPRHVPGIPGGPFVVSGSALPGRSGAGGAGRGLLAAGALLIVGVAGSSALPWWRTRQSRARRRAAAASTDTYRTLWERTDQAAATLALGDADAEKAWLRDVGRAVRRLLGARVCGDETAFLGGAGTSAAEIREVVRSRDGVGADEALSTLEEIDALSDVAEPRLHREQAEELRQRVARLVAGRQA